MGLVNRCICSNISFEEVKRTAIDHNLSSVEKLREKGICTHNCNLCAPYIKKMLKTGKTEFLPMSMSESDK